MIAYIKGEIAQITEDNLVLDTGAIGYNIRISAGTAQLLPSIGEEIKIYTYTHVREDAFLLYGFLTMDDLEIFKKLITVSGIGPKGGLAVLSVMSADDLRIAIFTGDAKAIAKAPGVGIKTAERVILDLKDKVSIEDTFVSKEAVTYAQPDHFVRNEAVEALTALGYMASDAMKAVKQVEMTENITTEEVLKAALKKML